MPSRSTTCSAIFLQCASFSVSIRNNFFVVIDFCITPLCYFREHGYHFGADLSDIFAFHPTPETVKEKYFSVL